MEKELFAFNYSCTLLELQKSLNSYLDALESLTSSVEENNQMTKSSKKRARRTAAATISTLIEVQKVIHNKINLLSKHWERIDPTLLETSLLSNKEKDPLFVIKQNTAYGNMNKYHYRKKVHYSIEINLQAESPGPVWKNDNNHIYFTALHN